MPTGGICPSCRKPFSAAPLNPFSDQAQDVNPYSSPVSAGAGAGAGAAATGATGNANPLFVPALILLALWIFWTCYMIFVMVMVLSPTGPFKALGSTRDMMVASYATMAVISLVSTAGAVAMLRQRPKWLAWTAAVLGLVPVMGPCFGLTLPVAIWAIMLLRRPDVNAQFS
jgi:hypothetical protein